MELEIQTSQVVGLSSDMHWSQTAASGNILVTLELISSGAFSAKNEGDHFLNGLIDLLKKRQPQDKLAFSLLVTQYLSASLIQNFIISLLVGICLGGKIYLLCKKSGSALIKRGTTWSEIISNEGFASGLVQDQDILIFETETFRKLLPHRIILEKFSLTHDPQIAGEKLGAILQNFDDSKGAAAVFAMFKKTEVSFPASEAGLPKVQGETPYSPDDIVGVGTGVKTTTIPEVEIEKIIPRQEVTAYSQEPVQTPPKKILSLFREQKESFLSLFASPKKRILLVALVLCIILGVSLVIGKGNLGSERKTQEDTARLETITHQIEEGEGLVGLNDLRSKTVLREAESALLPLRDKYNKGTKERIQIEELLLRAQNALSTSAKEYKIDAASTFLDLTVVKAGSSATNMVLYEDTLVVLDTKNTSVISVNTANLASAIVGGGDKTPQPTLIAMHGNNIFVLTKLGLVRIDTKAKTQQVIVKDLKEITSPLKMVGFAGNIYLLDGSRKIWKFMALESGYSDARPYLTEGETIGLENVASMAIDGSVWVLGDNRVKKYTKGSENAVSLEGLDKPLVSATVIYTDDISKYFYILDKGASRVVVFDKDGLYNSQYVWSGITNVTDMVVSEKLKKILLLSGSIIYGIELK